MTDSFGTVDAGLWTAAVVLLAAAVWLTRREAPSWNPAVLFGGALRALLPDGPFPLREGPVPAEGWDGKPEDLDPGYDPKERLAPSCTWADVRGWTPAATSSIARRLQGVRLVWMEPPTLEIPGLTPAIVSTEAEILALLPNADDRVVFAGSVAADPLLRLLHSSARLRDRVRAVVLVRPELDEAWLAEAFTHAGFEVEVSREVPYFTLRDGPEGRLPEPALPRSGMRSLAAIDLGVLPEAAFAEPAVGRALAVVIAAVA